jgi:hypothetical protein
LIWRISWHASAKTGLSASGSSESASSISAHTAGTTFSAPTVMNTPSSRSRPRSAFNRAVRSVIQPWRIRCSEVSSCCGTVLIGTGRMSSFRLASRIPLASVRSVLFRFTYGRTW